MTPEQHFTRGLELLSNAETFGRDGHNVQADCALAQTHFAAANTANSLRMFELAIQALPAADDRARLAADTEDS